MICARDLADQRIDGPDLDCVARDASCAIPKNVAGRIGMREDQHPTVAECWRDVMGIFGTLIGFAATRGRFDHDQGLIASQQFEYRLIRHP